MQDKYVLCEYQVLIAYFWSGNVKDQIWKESNLIKKKLIH